MSGDGSAGGSVSSSRGFLALLQGDSGHPVTRLAINFLRLGKVLCGVGVHAGCSVNPSGVATLMQGERREPYLPPDAEDTVPATPSRMRSIGPASNGISPKALDHSCLRPTCESVLASRAWRVLTVLFVSDGPYSAHNNGNDVWGNPTSREGWGGGNPQYTVSYTNNRRVELSYDAAGNLTNDGGQDFKYDATGQQVKAVISAIKPLRFPSHFEPPKTEKKTPEA